jgi:hypothetical protein
MNSIGQIIGMLQHVKSEVPGAFGNVQVVMLMFYLTRKTSFSK